jgi:membrane protease YdiL (CAAX protease family)
MLRRSASVVAVCFVAMSATLTFQLVWSEILATNLKVAPGIPWSVAVMALLLWTIWRYFGGAWWPASTREARRRYRRAEPVPARSFAWAIIAGLLALGALIALWLIIDQLVRVPGNPSADFANYSPLTVVSVVTMASLVGAVAEELGLRGYMLTRLEAQVSGWTAVAIVALVASPGHGMTQGFAVPTLLWYFAADVMLGSLALLARSILPGILVHLVGLLVFFSVIWPTDRYRHPASLAQQGQGFWIEVLACIALATLSFLAFRRLASTTSHSPGYPAKVAGEISTGWGTGG